MTEPRHHDGEDGEFFISFKPDSLSRDFLSPSEDNFGLLTERISWLQKALLKKGSQRPGIRDMAEVFKYSEELKDSQLPRGAATQRLALWKSLEAFEGTFRPHHPHSLFNIAPSPMIDAVALSALTIMNNPNAIWDLSSGKFSLIEQRVIRYLGTLAGWSSPPDGAFTSGGKATLMYAVKMGLNICDPAVVKTGARNKYLVIASPAVHFSLESVCNFLGVGTNSCARVPADSHGRIDTAALKKILLDAIGTDQLIPAIILGGGALIDTKADPVREVRQILLDVVAKKGLAYVPPIHLDCVVTWPWLAFRHTFVEEYDELRCRARLSIRELAMQVSEVEAADSFGVDFHKTGLTPYASSCFVTRNSNAFRQLNYSSGEIPFEEDYYGQFCSFDRTLENSRSCTGIISAYYVLLRLGSEGLQRYIIRWTEISDDIRVLIAGRFQALGMVVNQSSLGIDVVIRLNLGMSDDTVRNLEFSPLAVQQEYKTLAMGFREWTLSSAYCRTSPVPILGYIPQYRPSPSSEAFPAFLLFPNSLYSSVAELSDVLTRLSDAINEFLKQKDHIALGAMDWEGRPLPPR